MAPHDSLFPESTPTSRDESSDDEIVVEGVIDRVTYANPDNAWSVVRVEREDGRSLTAVGRLLGAQPGESVRLRGRWEDHPRHGRQLRVDSYLPIEPSTLQGIERYLGSGLVPGIGKEMAARLVAHFGRETLDIIEHSAERLREVEGIGAKRANQIARTWQEQKDQKETVIFLQSHGLSTSLAARVIRRYRDQTLARVRENPYRMAQDIPGIGFRTADGIAASLGIEGDHPARVAAGIEYALENAADSGHLFLPRDELIEAATETLRVTSEVVVTAIEASRQAGQVVIVDPKRVDTPIYLRALFESEAESVHYLRKVLDGEGTSFEVDVERAIEWCEGRFGITLARRQREALSRSTDCKVLVITGGPGTGKTTVINAILAVLERKGLEARLAAPTGRAAKRMQQATGRDASTLHRLLEYNPREGAFTRGPEAPLEGDLFVIDEMSMVDQVLFHRFVRALPAHARLIVVGDVDQLPAVGPGNVLRDLIESDTIPVVILDEIYRQEEASDIVLNAHRIHDGQFPESSRRADDGGDFFVVHRESEEEIRSTLLDFVTTRIPRRFGVEPHEVQVLAPMQRGPLGVARLNQDLQTALNPTGPEVVRGNRTLRVGDRVMQIRNNYDLDVFNGDIGRIRTIEESGARIDVDYEGRNVTYQTADQDDLVLSYACSIHKSQGSEYPVVVVPLHTSHYVLLERNLLYTAVTRGRRLLLLIGSHRAIGRAVHHCPIVQRYSRLAELLARSVG